MMHFRKTRRVSTLFAFTLALLLVACGDSDQGGGDGDSDKGGGEGGSAEGGGGSTGGDDGGAPDKNALVEVAASTAGTVRGVVRFEGTPPPRTPISLESEPHCEGQHEEPLLSETVIVNEDGTLRNVVVSVKRGLPAGRWPTPSAKVRLSQRGCRYIPHVFAMQAGQTLLIVNEDQTSHNVNLTSKRNGKFNIQQVTEGTEDEKLLKNAETSISVQCDIHTWMSSNVHVFKHPYFRVTGDGGSFEIGNLPPGTYTLEAIHELYGKQTVEVELTASGTAEANFTYKAR